MVVTGWVQVMIITGMGVPVGFSMGFVMGTGMGQGFMTRNPMGIPTGAQKSTCTHTHQIPTCIDPWVSV
jgi:hypothetical protein